MITTTADEIVTRIQLRLQEAHRERDGSDDLDVGYRMGLLHALTIASAVKNDAEASERAHR